MQSCVLQYGAIFILGYFHQAFFHEKLLIGIFREHMHKTLSLDHPLGLKESFCYVRKDAAGQQSHLKNLNKQELETCVSVKGVLFIWEEI